MMPHVVRGDRMSGLMVYLTGPGRHNEHTEPHLVAGDAAMMAWHDDAELGRDSALAIARHLDRPRRAFDVTVPRGHVWHASLSLRAEEGVRSDEEWGAIARDFVAAMGFDDNEGTKAPCRWVAVRHGVSGGGNDHIHIAVNLVREDGTKASVHNDFHRAQVATRALEVRYGLEQLESVRGERSTRGYDPGEREAQARARARAKYEQARAGAGGSAPAWEQLPGLDKQARIAAEVRADQPRHALARTVRACASASGDEAEFVRRMRRSGLLVRPRFADGRTDVVVGFSVAARPEAGERPIWYGGGRLARDLTLPRLRDQWPDTPAGASAAAAEWTAAKRGRRVVAAGREAHELDPALWERYAREVGELREQLRQVPLDDRDTWARVARDTAGAFAAWSRAVEDTPGDLAAASDALARSAQTFRRPTAPRKAGMVAVSGAAMVLASAARGGQGPAAQAAMLRQLMRLSQAVYDAAKAVGELRQAASIAADVRGRLDRLRRELAPPVAATATPAPPAAAAVPAVSLDPEAAEVLRRLQGGQRPATEATSSPLPNVVQPAGPRTISQPGPDRGPER